MHANHMAVDQYGQTYHNLGPYPRKALLGLFGRKHADKMYVDKFNAPPVHIGYVIARHWLAIYEVTRWERKV